MRNGLGRCIVRLFAARALGFGRFYFRFRPLNDWLNAWLSNWSYRSFSRFAFLCASVCLFPANALRLGFWLHFGSSFCRRRCFLRSGFDHCRFAA